MSAKMAPARRAAFFEALEATGNYSIAATRAKVSQSWVTLHKTNDPGFAAECRAAVTAAEARLVQAPGNMPAEAWGFDAGEELVIRGTVGCRAQIGRARIKQWTARTEAVFLARLAATANVKASCAAAGLSVPSAYIRRAKYNRFRELWADAIEIGATRLDLMLLTNAINSVRDAEIDASSPIPPMTAAQAIQLMQMWKKARAHGGNRSQTFRRVRDWSEVRDGIARKIETIRRAEEAGLVRD